ncbi:MAG: hypothetical protein UT40_C0043G0004 [Candidatus Woesebacteria bacterium GW2011_GWA1_39_21b]|uniref:Uncharacterized protein n=1 Tax=Candidatus Woesebacteria bacterium GW2011_GWA1_39_21b TaxID=1618551 RepID=A0A0G0NDL3_9BACT|nr:MAG: hypothetical protein US72_C0017G0021 [Microgenomates group bacterium GW2011_GWC1_38_12]KKR10911.1 MAG: hypothetical protein UT40_C0043G0004 [Candidatus Woesebacteria bacterium GW2011_GWA1_39_21b]
MDKKLFIIVVLAFFLRFYLLSVIPVGFNPDEASFGYDAYSILKTGKDQWGYSWPLVLESFGDFKSPLYTYLAMPSVAMFDLSKFSVRLPNALLGTAAVYITYLLVTVLQKDIKNRSPITDNRSLASIAALLLAISPWHIMMSRGAFEANLTTFLLPLGIYLFLKGLLKPKFFIGASIIFGLNIFTYHAAKLVTPVVLVSLIIVFLKDLKKFKRKEIVFPVIILSLFLTVFAYTLFQGSSTRALDVIIFKSSLGASASERLNDTLSGMPDFLARLLHNKFQVSVLRLANNYLQYFSPLFLFSQGPAEGTYGMIPGRGVLYWFELPFLIGALAFILERRLNRYFLPFLVWLLVAPIPAALSTGPGYAANRGVVILPVLQIFLAVGFVKCLSFLNNGFLKSYKRLISIPFLFFSAYLFVMFLDDYFIQSPYKTAKARNYGNLEVAYWLNENAADKDEIVVSTKLSEPHIYIAFAKKWDPKSYQEATSAWRYQELGLGWLDQMPEYKLGNYIFRPINWVSEDKDRFLVGKPEEFPENLSQKIIVSYPNNDPAIYVVTPQKHEYAKTY